MARKSRRAEVQLLRVQAHSSCFKVVCTRYGAELTRRHLHGPQTMHGVHDVAVRLQAGKAKQGRRGKRAGCNRVRRASNGLLGAGWKDNAYASCWFKASYSLPAGKACQNAGQNASHPMVTSCCAEWQVCRAAFEAYDAQVSCSPPSLGII